MIYVSNLFTLLIPPNPYLTFIQDDVISPLTSNAIIWFESLGRIFFFLNSGVQQHTDFTVTIAFCSMQRHAACTAVSQIHGTVLQKKVTVSGSLIKVKQGLITCLF